MRNLLIIVLLIFASRVICEVTNNDLKGVSTTGNFDSLEVFLSITVNDPTVFSKVKNNINLMNGVVYYSYCSNHAVFMIYIDKSIYPTKNDFLQQLLKALPQYSEVINIKNGAFKDLVNHCIVTNTQEAATVKNDFGK